MVRRACKQCKRIVKSNVCPVCKGDTTTTFKGTVVIFDVESELAKRLGITAPGTYALKV